MERTDWKEALESSDLGRFVAVLHAVGTERGGGREGRERGKGGGSRKEREGERCL